MKHLAAVSALIIATDNAVISTDAQVARMMATVEDLIAFPTPANVQKARMALECLTFLKENVDDVHEYAVVLAYDLFNEASEDYR